MKKMDKVNFFRNLNTRFLFWFFFIISWFLIVMIKFSPLKEIHTSETIYFSWFHYGFELGETLFGLSISYIVSCIFYYIVVYLPEEKKRTRAMKIIEKRIDLILGDMGVIIHYYFYKNGIVYSDNEALKERVEEINKIDFDKVMDFNYQYVEKETGEVIPFSTGHYTELMLLKEYRSSIQQKINELFKIPIIINVDHNLIVILEEINNCLLFNAVSGFETIEKLPGEYNVKTPGFGRDLFKFYTLYKGLSQYIEPTKYMFEQKG
ncbi:hypothetical protein [Bacillus thuringiensis]|uniref:hypothetical protein n=1 Tax=Bacillus thuringiensis TaxID=1428 RepID=UPI000BF8F9CC|nr:hypothetical protein [Bacillus thuringiensis]PFS65524.1 hypothetical protein COK87_01940 [Bacillus thuringiensis]